MAIRSYRGHWLNRKGTSSVFQVDRRWNRIYIYFLPKDKIGRVYVYYKDVIGKQTYLEMRELSERGRGLNTYINKNKPQHSGSDSFSVGF